MKDKIRALLTEPLLRNSLYLLLSTATMAALGFIFWLLVAHLYKPEQVGIASTLISSMNFIAYFALLGVDSTFIRFLPKSKTRNEQIDTGLTLVSLATLVVAGLFAVIAPLYIAPKLNVLHQHPLFGIVFVLLCIGASVNLVTDSIFIAYRATGYNLIVDGFIGSGTQLLLPIAFIVFGAFGIYAAQGTAAFLAMIASIYFLARKFSYIPHFRISRRIIREIRHYSFASYTSSLIEILPTIALPIIVLDTLGAAPAGYYYLATMMANVLFAVAFSVAQSLFAEGAYAEKQLSALVKRAVMFMSLGIVPASLAMAIVGPFVLTFFGKSYGVHSREAIIVLAASGPFVAAFALGNAILSITKQLKSLVFINVAYTLSSCALALLWAHRGLAWVAAAWLVGHAVGAAVSFVIIGYRWISVRTTRRKFAV